MTVYLRCYNSSGNYSHVYKEVVSRVSIWPSEKLYPDPEGNPCNLLCVVLWFEDGSTTSFTDCVDVDTF